MSKENCENLSILPKSSDEKAEITTDVYYPGPLTAEAKGCAVRKIDIRQSTLWRRQLVQ